MITASAENLLSMKRSNQVYNINTFEHFLFGCMPWQTSNQIYHLILRSMKSRFLSNGIVCTTLQPACLEQWKRQLLQSSASNWVDRLVTEAHARDPLKTPKKNKSQRVRLSYLGHQTSSVIRTTLIDTALGEKIIQPILYRVMPESRRPILLSNKILRSIL